MSKSRSSGSEQNPNSNRCQRIKWAQRDLLACTNEKSSPSWMHMDVQMGSLGLPPLSSMFLGGGFSLRTPLFTGSSLPAPNELNNPGRKPVSGFILIG